MATKTYKHRQPLPSPAALTGPLLTTAELVEQTNLKNQYFRECRIRGDGPPFYKVGRRVLYRKADVDAWLAARKQQSTADEAARKAS